MGASEVYGFTTPEETFPAQLQRILRERLPESQIEVVNGGAIGYTSWQIFSNFALHALELEPDVAVFYLGRNDIERREIAPDCYRGTNALLGLDPTGRISTDLAFRQLSPSVLYRFVSITLGMEPDPADFEARSTVIDVGCARDDGPANENLALNPPVYFRRNIENAVAVAQVQDVNVLLASYAYLEETTEPTDEWRAAMAEHNDILRAVAEEAGVAYLDYAAVAPQDRAMWSDYYHPNGQGSGMQAEIFAEALIEAGLVH
ncbi:MAG: SGNH/GDSL hydrolase family protein [Chloroflexi bacterium]|nr:SGNH/GDSL hydrolase family protein [Chloroflexota bacterium]